MRIYDDGGLTRYKQWHVLEAGDTTLDLLEFEVRSKLGESGKRIIVDDGSQIDEMRKKAEAYDLIEHKIIAFEQIERAYYGESNWIPEEVGDHEVKRWRLDKEKFLNDIYKALGLAYEKDMELKAEKASMAEYEERLYNFIKTKLQEGEAE